MNSEATLTPKQIEGQKLLASKARYVQFVGGARSGKTFLLCRAIALRAMKSPGSRHLIARLRFNHVKRSIWRDTMPKVLETYLPGVKVKPNKADFFWQFPNGSEIWIGGLDEKERTEKILGQEYVTIYLNEASEISWSSVELVKTRLAQNAEGLRQKMYVDCNPPLSSHWTNRLFVRHTDPQPPYEPLGDPENYVWLRINPRDNEQNLSPEFLESLQNLSPRARARFWDGEWGSETENALWTVESIGKWRVRSYPDLQRVVVGVDPSGTKGTDEDKRSDYIGIVVVGLGTDGKCYVLEDATIKARPSVWGKAVVSAYQRYDADCIVAETNFGGAMVEAVIRAAANEMRTTIAYKEVKASRGKVVRAEPISHLYDKGDIRHVGSFHELEDQMCNFTSLGYMGDRSPDRADALIWALTDLFPGLTKKVRKKGNGGVTLEGINTFDPLRG
jgi:PBSX family phage terminase large subunit